MFFHCFSEKIRLYVSNESAAGQRIHMKSQVLFSSKDKSKILKCRLLQFSFGALRVNNLFIFILSRAKLHGVAVKRHPKYFSRVQIIVCKTLIP